MFQRVYGVYNEMIWRDEAPNDGFRYEDVIVAKALSFLGEPDADGIYTMGLNVAMVGMSLDLDIEYLARAFEDAGMALIATTNTTPYKVYFIRP
jgi:hypothetical protein